MDETIKTLRRATLYLFLASVSTAVYIGNIAATFNRYQQVLSAVDKSIEESRQMESDITQAYSNIKTNNTLLTVSRTLASIDRYLKEYDQSIDRHNQFVNLLGENRSPLNISYDAEKREFVYVKTGTPLLEFWKSIRSKGSIELESDLVNNKNGNFRTLFEQLAQKDTGAPKEDLRVCLLTIQSFYSVLNRYRTQIESFKTRSLSVYADKLSPEAKAELKKYEEANDNLQNKISDLRAGIEKRRHLTNKDEALVKLRSDVEKEIVASVSVSGLAISGAALLPFAPIVLVLLFEWILINLAQMRLHCFPATDQKLIANWVFLFRGLHAIGFTWLSSYTPAIVALSLSIVNALFVREVIQSLNLGFSYPSDQTHSHVIAITCAIVLIMQAGRFNRDRISLLRKTNINRSIVLPGETAPN